jgi:FAD-linked sulfhydryl oxidase
MYAIPRFPRLFLIVLLTLVLPTLYLLYPNPRAPSPADGSFQAGGIDSEHYRKPILPGEESKGWEHEEVREWEEGSGDEMGASRGETVLAGLEDEVLGGGVIMPKLENATAK